MLAGILRMLVAAGVDRVIHVPILDRWTSNASDARSVVVLPDGCRDLIVALPNDGPPGWHVSALFDRPLRVDIGSGTSMRGWRLQPGVAIDTARLIAIAGKLGPDERAIEYAISEHCRLSADVDAALAALRAPSTTVAQAARAIGVHPRTLERLLVTATERAPRYWLQLARVRRAAREIECVEGLADLAAMHGYADHAHLTRAVRHWLGTTPSAFRRDVGLRAVVGASGFD